MLHVLRSGVRGHSIRSGSGRGPQRLGNRVELGGEVVAPLPNPMSSVLCSIRAAWRAASGLPGWLGCGRWRFISSVTGGTFVATNTNSAY